MRHTKVDLLICYQCRQVEMFDGGQPRFLAIAAVGQDVLDDALRSAGVPLAPR